MPPVNRLRQLTARLKVLEKHFLPSSFSLTGAYSPRQTDGTKAYIVLAHAELEAYFEDIARNKADVAEQHWTLSSRCTAVLSRLLFFHNTAEKKPLGSPAVREVTKALNYYSGALESNHGIKEKHLLSIFLPLGVSHADLDTRLIAGCNQLSQKRGQFAHASFKTHQQVDPKSERDNIWNNIIPQIKQLNAKLKRL